MTGLKNRVKRLEAKSAAGGAALTGLLLRLYIRGGTLSAAIEMYEKMNGRPLLASPAFLQRVEHFGIQILETVRQMDAMTSGRHEE